jgi:Zn finger protein HypA/HybF involved in hydrogenase expression
MWIFKRKKNEPEAQKAGQICPQCKSTRTRVIAYDLTEQPDYVRTWRGQRYVTCRCDNCGSDFYVEQPQGQSVEVDPGDNAVEDEEALRAAEDELKRQADEEDDHTFR